MPHLLQEEPEIDCRVEPWYHAFLSLNSYRHADVGMNGAIYQPLTPREILDWVEYEDQELTVFGKMVFKALDNVFMEYKNEQKKPKVDGETAGK